MHQTDKGSVLNSSQHVSGFRRLILVLALAALVWTWVLNLLYLTEEVPRKYPGRSGWFHLVQGFRDFFGEEATATAWSALCWGVVGGCWRSAALVQAIYFLRQGLLRPVRRNGWKSPPIQHPREPAGQRSPTEAAAARLEAGSGVTGQHPHEESDPDFARYVELTTSNSPGQSVGVGSEAQSHVATTRFRLVFNVLCWILIWGLWVVAGLFVAVSVTLPLFVLVHQVWSTPQLPGVVDSASRPPPLLVRSPRRPASLLVSTMLIAMMIYNIQDVAPKAQRWIHAERFGLPGEGGGGNSTQIWFPAEAAGIMPFHHTNGGSRHSSGGFPFSTYVTHSVFVDALFACLGLSVALAFPVWLRQHDLRSAACTAAALRQRNSLRRNFTNDSSDEDSEDTDDVAVDALRERFQRQPSLTRMYSDSVDRADGRKAARDYEASSEDEEHQRQSASDPRQQVEQNAESGGQWDDLPSQFRIRRAISFSNSNSTSSALTSLEDDSMGSPDGWCYRWLLRPLWLTGIFGVLLALVFLTAGGAFLFGLFLLEWQQLRGALEDWEEAESEGGRVRVMSLLDGPVRIC